MIENLKLYHLSGDKRLEFEEHIVSKELKKDWTTEVLSFDLNKSEVNHFQEFKDNNSTLGLLRGGLEIYIQAPYIDTHWLDTSIHNKAITRLGWIVEDVINSDNDQFMFPYFKEIFDEFFYLIKKKSEVIEVEWQDLKYDVSYVDEDRDNNIRYLWISTMHKSQQLYFHHLSKTSRLRQSYSHARINTEVVGIFFHLLNKNGFFSTDHSLGRLREITGQISGVSDKQLQKYFQNPKKNPFENTSADIRRFVKKEITRLSEQVDTYIKELPH